MTTSDKLRLARGLVGTFILILGAKKRSWWGLLGILPLAAGISGYCPFGKSFDEACPLNVFAGEEPRS